MTSLLEPSNNLSKSSRMLSKLAVFYSISSFFIFLANLTKDLVATNYTDLSSSVLSVFIEKSTILFYNAVVYSFGKNKLSEHVATHHRHLPLRYELIYSALSKSVLTMVSRMFTKLKFGFRIVYIYISSIKSPSKIYAISILLCTCFLFLLMYISSYNSFFATSLIPSKSSMITNI